MGLIEVANSSLAYDRDTKGPLYAAAGVPEYLIESLAEDCIDRFTEPRPGGYGRKERFARGEALTLGRFPNVRIDPADVLPPVRTN